VAEGELEEKLGYRFADPALLERALTHTSFVNESAEPRPESNERLEFLGDAVLDLLVAERLFRDRPELSEGVLTPMRAAVVKLETLGRVGGQLELGRYLRLGRGEEAARGRSKVVGRALEAIFGAVYLDGGLEAARSVVLRLLDPEICRLGDEDVQNPKSQLQELVLKRRPISPTYRTVEMFDSGETSSFAVEVLLADEVLGHGRGRTKQDAEKAAARDALSRITPGGSRLVRGEHAPRAGDDAE